MLIELQPSRNRF